MKSTIKKNLNVLEHTLGNFKNQLGSDEKQEKEKAPVSKKRPELLLCLGSREELESGGYVG